MRSRRAFGGRHLESVEESVDQRDGLVVPARGAQALLQHQGAADRGDDDRDGGGREFVCVDAVFADDEVQRGDLHLAPPLRPRRDLGPDLLAVVGKSHELQQQPGVLGFGEGIPEGVQRAVGGQRFLLALQVDRGAATENGQIQLVHGGEVVVHQCRFDAGFGRDPARGGCGVALLDHDLNRCSDQHVAGGGVPRLRSFGCGHRVVLSHRRFGDHVEEGRAGVRDAVLLEHVDGVGDQDHRVQQVQQPVRRRRAMRRCRARSGRRSPPRPAARRRRKT